MSKKVKIIILCGVIILIVFLILLFLNLDSNKSNSTLPVDTNSLKYTPKINNNISYDISNIKFNIPTQNLSTNAKYYTLDKIPSDFVKNIAVNLEMNRTTDNIGVVLEKYQDSNNNSISLFPDGSTIKIINNNNNHLKGFNKNNIVQKLEDLFNTSLSNYYLQSESKNTSTSTGFVFIYKVNSIPLISDFSEDSFLYAIIDDSGNLINLTFTALFPKADKEETLSSLDYIKTNFNKLKLGIYPNFSPISSQLAGTENIDKYEDFVGSIEVNNVELSYLWSKDNSQIFTPVYRFTCKFYFSTGTITDGTIIVPAKN